MKRGSGMVDRENSQGIGEFLGFAMCFGDGFLREKMSQRMAAKRHNDPRLDQRDLQHEPRHALLFLNRFRVTISGRAKFHHIADVNVFAREPDGCEQLI